MSRGSVDYHELEEFRDRIKALEDQDRNALYEACAKELAARLLAKVIKRTHVGQYPKGSGKTGGTLRRGWTAGENRNAAEYARSLPVRQEGSDYIIEIFNPVEYAPYVEYGHRTANHKGWVDGKFMMTISVKELETQAPKILARKIDAYLREHFK